MTHALRKDLAPELTPGLLSLVDARLNSRPRLFVCERPIRQAPLVSVVMPAHNVAAFVAEAVQSLRDQSWLTMELIVVDDGSTDETPQILSALAAQPSHIPMHVIHQAKTGVSHARNVGLQAATGELILFLDADDTLDAECVQTLVRTLEARPELHLVFPRWRYVDQTGASLGIETRAPSDVFGATCLLGDNPIHSATGVMVRRKTLETVGGFDESLNACVDLDLWVRLTMQEGDSALAIPEALAFYRRREGQITSNWRRMEANWGKVMDKACNADDAIAKRREALRAQQGIIWSALAYEQGDFPSARRLIFKAFSRAPVPFFQTVHPPVRLLAALASMLPPRIHDGVRRTFNNARKKAGLDLS